MVTDIKACQIDGSDLHDSAAERGAGKPVGVPSQNGADYSNFQQGAGEDSVLDPAIAESR